MTIALASFALGNIALAAHAYGQGDWGAVAGNTILAIGCLLMAATTIQ